jgi:hypothetical protein
MFLLNTTGFLGAVILHKWEMKATDWAAFFAATAVITLASALWRRQFVRQEPDADIAARLFSGGYEGAMAASAALAAGAIVERFTGVRMAFALFVEAQTVVLAGIALNDRFLRVLGGVLHGLTVVKLGIEYEGGGRAWGWLAAGAGLTYYVNRYLMRGAWPYTAVGSTLLLAVSARELPAAWVAPVWACAVLAVVWITRKTGLDDLAWQSHALAVLAVWRVFYDQSAIRAPGPRLTSGLVAVGALFAAHLLLRQARFIGPLAALALAAVIEREVQGRLLTVALALEAVGLVAAGFFARDRMLRLSGLAMFVFCIGRVFLYDLRQLDTLARILSFIVLGLMLLGASWAYTRYREQIRKYL